MAKLKFRKKVDQMYTVIGAMSPEDKTPKALAKEEKAKAKEEKKAQKKQTKKEKAEKKGKSPKKDGESLSAKIWSAAGDSVDAADEMGQELGEILGAGGNALITVGATLVSYYDNFAAVVEWKVLQLLVHSGRRLHEFRLKTLKYKKEIIKNAVVLGAGCIAMVGVFAWATDYEYSYNGRALGVVHEQRDVLEILDLASEELSQEYGSNIVIDPETEIEFRPVISYGREIDTEDDVLRRLTYMGEINAQASAIMANGEIVAVVENEQIANQVLQDLIDLFITDADTVEYEEIGFVEDVEIESYSTTLVNISSRAAAVEKLRNGGQQASEYIVQSGDTMFGICEKLGLTMSQLSALNPGLTADSLIHQGDSIKIEQEIPLLTLKTVEVSTFAESIPFETEYQDSSYYYEGESVVSRNGQEGRTSVTARLTRYNGEIVEREDLSSEVIVQPVSKVILRGTKPVPPRTGTGSFIRPVNVSIYSGYGYRWGRMHYGIDLSASTGTPIKAADGGTVTYAGWYYGYGYTVMISHGANTETLYGHCSRLYVSVGEQVFQGQTIAAVGNTGNSTGSHCHFEIIINGSHVNPAYYV